MITTRHGPHELARKSCMPQHRRARRGAARRRRPAAHPLRRAATGTTAAWGPAPSRTLQAESSHPAPIGPDGRCRRGRLLPRSAAAHHSYALRAATSWPITGRAISRPPDGATHRFGLSASRWGRPDSLEPPCCGARGGWHGRRIAARRCSTKWRESLADETRPLPYDRPEDLAQQDG